MPDRRQPAWRAEARRLGSRADERKILEKIRAPSGNASHIGAAQSSGNDIGRAAYFFAHEVEDELRIGLIRVFDLGGVAGAKAEEIDGIDCEMSRQVGDIVLILFP